MENCHVSHMRDISRFSRYRITLFKNRFATFLVYLGRYFEIKCFFSYSVGVINHRKVNAFERILWRACRRTAFLRHAEIEEDLENPDTVSFGQFIFGRIMASDFRARRSESPCSSSSTVETGSDQSSIGFFNPYNLCR